MPNFPETSPQDEYQEIEENEPEQVQEFQEIPDIQEVPIQQPKENIQNQIESTSYQPSSQNYEGDILLQSSLGAVDLGNTYTTQILSNEIDGGTKIAQPIYQSYQMPINNNIGMNNIEMNEYNNINTNKSYSYPAQNNINNDQLFAKVMPINNNISGNEINSQYGQNEQNIIYSTPIQIRQNINNNNNNNINELSSPFGQQQPKLTPINYINSNSNFASGLENEIIDNDNNINQDMKNLNLREPKNEITIKLKEKNNPNIINNNNISKSNFLKQKKNNETPIKKQEDFSRDSWTLFYPENDPFFTSMNNFRDIIPNQRIENPGRNEIYIGDINNLRQRHGYGRLICPEFEKEGTWKNNRFNGWGREIRDNGEIYEGKFINDSLTGKGKYKKGNILYIGDFEDYAQHGKGELFTEEYHYTGDFNKNGFDGYGRIELYDIGVYEGEFKDKEITGYGVFKYCNGDFYEGDMVGGKKEGFGIFKRADGRMFEGEFYNDKFVQNDKLHNKKKYYNKKSYK